MVTSLLLKLSFSENITRKTVCFENGFANLGASDLDKAFFANSDRLNSDYSDFRDP